MATLDDTRRVLCAGGPRRSQWQRLALGPSDVSRLRGRLFLLRSLLARMSPRRSLVFLIEPGDTLRLSPGKERRDAEHIRVCVSDIMARDTSRGLRRMKGRALSPESSGGFAEGILVAMSVSEFAAGSGLARQRRLVLEDARTNDMACDSRLLAASEGYVHEAIAGVICAMALGSESEIGQSVADAITARGPAGADALIGMYMALRARLPERLAVTGGAADRGASYRTSTIFRTADFPQDSSRRK